MKLILIKYQFLKKNHTVQKILSNTLLDTVIMIRSLCMKLPQMIGYIRKFEGNTTMPFKINDRKLLKRYNQIWKRVGKLSRIEFDSKPVYGDNDKLIKTKIEIYGGSVNTNFQGKKMTKEKAPYKSLSIIMLDPVVKAKKSIILKLFWRNTNRNQKI